MLYILKLVMHPDMTKHEPVSLNISLVMCTWHYCMYEEIGWTDTTESQKV